LRNEPVTDFAAERQARRDATRRLVAWLVRGAAGDEWLIGRRVALLNFLLSSKPTPDQRKAFMERYGIDKSALSQALSSVESAWLEACNLNRHSPDENPS
jgi:hypothetical protein